MIRIELLGVARHRAGAAELDVEAGTIGEALISLITRFPALDGVVAANGALTAGFRVALNGVTITSDPKLTVQEGDVLVVLSADAGG